MKTMLFAVALGLFGLVSAAESQSFQRYWVRHQGREIEVYGYKNADGSVNWEPGIAENARPRERRPEPVQVRAPKATIKTTPDSTVAPPDWRTHGVAPDRLDKSKEAYTATTPEAARFVTEAVEGVTAAKIHVTVIGNDDERARVVNDIKTDPAFVGLRDRLYVQDYKPEEWPVDPSLGFIAGKPAIVVQSAKGPTDPKGGRVIFRTLDYAIGAAGLAEAIRKADPNYRPDQDPTPGKPGPSNPPSSPIDLNDGVFLGVAALYLAFIWFVPRREG